MAEVLDAFLKAVLYSFLPWIFVMVPTSAALAYRLGWRPGLGALAGCIPIPFVGWLVVWFAARSARSTGAGPESSGPTPTPLRAWPTTPPGSN